MDSLEALRPDVWLVLFLFTLFLGLTPCWLCSFPGGLVLLSFLLVVSGCFPAERILGAPCIWRRSSCAIFTLSSSSNLT